MGPWIPMMSLAIQLKSGRFTKWKIWKKDIKLVPGKWSPCKQLSVQPEKQLLRFFYKIQQIFKLFF